MAPNGLFFRWTQGGLGGAWGYFKRGWTASNVVLGEVDRDLRFVSIGLHGKSKGGDGGWSLSFSELQGSFAKVSTEISMGFQAGFWLSMYTLNMRE